MFKNTPFFDMDEALIRVLNLLANIGDVSNTRKFIFDPATHSFKPRQKKTIPKDRLLQVNGENLSYIGFFASIYAFLIALSVAYKHPQTTTYPWSPIVIILLLSLVFLAASSISFIALMFIRVKKSRKNPAGKIINKAIEDVIAYQPVVRELHAIAKSNKQTLKSAELIINNLIDEIQAREKNISNLLPILAPAFIVLIIWLGFPIQLSVNTSLYNTIITIVGTGTLILPILKFIAESESQSQILKLKKCLFLLEQAQARINNTDQEVIPVTSTKLHPQFGSAKGLIQMSDDFDDPLTDFDDYIP